MLLFVFTSSNVSWTFTYLQLYGLYSENIYNRIKGVHHCIDYNSCVITSLAWSFYKNCSVKCKCQALTTLMCSNTRISKMEYLICKQISACYSVVIKVPFFWALFGTFTTLECDSRLIEFPSLWNGFYIIICL